jgi:hypothetical protein
MIVKNKTTKFIYALIIILIVVPTILFFEPKQAHAQFVVHDPLHTVVSIFNGVTGTGTLVTSASNTAFHIKDFLIEILKEIARSIMKKALADLTSGTVNWINSGFHGAPLFLTNSDSFFKDIAKFEVKSLIDLTGYDPNRFPFGAQFALNTINNYKRQFANNAQYSLSAVINDPVLLKNYRTNFNYGGWNGFLINTQYPQNNYMGYNMLATQELAQKLQGTVQNAAQKVQTGLNQGMGFLSPQTCPSNPYYNNGTNEFQKPTFKTTETYAPPQPEEFKTNAEYLDALDGYDVQYNRAVAAEKDAFNTLNTCPGGLKTTTPGAVAANQITTALGSHFATTELGSAVGGSIAAILDSLVNKFVGTGLTELGGLVNGAPPTDNWSFNGSTLGNTTSATVPGALVIPQNVSVDTATDTSTTISGGTLGYFIQTQPNVTIATAAINGATLTITGKSKGSTSVTIRDSSSTPKTVTVQINVNAPGDLVATPQNITANINDTATSTISGGTAPYIMLTSSNPAIATTIFSDTSLAVIGVATGSTSVVIQDSSTPSPKTTTITIKINGPTDLVVPKSVTLINITDKANITVSGGTPPYTFDDSALDTTIATATISGSDITINGVANGSTGIIVKDSSLPAQSSLINIQVGTLTPPSGSTTAPLGFCATSNDAQSNITAGICDAEGGVFTVNQPNINGVILGSCVTSNSKQSNITENDCFVIGGAFTANK